MKNCILTFVLLCCAMCVHAQKKNSTSNTSAITDPVKFYAYPVKYVNFTSQRQQVTMAYMYEKAATPNGRTVLLLHGKNFSSYYWGKVMKALLDKGYDVVAPDQLGFGLSAQPVSYQFSFQQLALNTRYLLDTLGIQQVSIVAHSLGGMLAVRFALMFPAYCTQVVLENPIGLEDWKLTVPYASIEQEYRSELNKNKEAVKKYMTENYFHNEWKKDYDPLVQFSATFFSRPDFTRYAWNMALTSDMIFTQPVCYEFPQVNVPVTLIIGQADRTAIGRERAGPAKADSLGNYVQLGKHAADAIPGSKLIPLKGLGHVPHIENGTLFINTLLPVLEKP